MVRVVSAHHFVSQSIQTCDVPTALTTAPPNRLLLALSHHIEVRDLSRNGEVLLTFPTVDQPRYIEFCSSGNYVASIEKKVTRQGCETSYVRLYTGWEWGKCGMRARIAGCVTPASSQIGADKELDIIELPLKFPNTSLIACCQATGNIVVVCEKFVSVYQLVMRSHDISRLKFLDFEPWPVTLELSFPPDKILVAEDVVSAMDKTSLHVFRINKGFARPSDWSSSGSPHSLKGKRLNKKAKKEAQKVENEGPIVLDDLLREVSDMTSAPRMTARLGNGSLPVLAMLPGIKCSLAHNPARNLRTSPFKPPQSVTMGIAVKETPANEPWAEQMTTMVESLLQLELGPGDESFTSLHLRPHYSVNDLPISPHDSSCPKLRSSSYNDLVAFSCFVTTQQEGYLYHFPVEDGEVMSLGKCISIYSFTSNVRHVCMEPYLIHVLTTTGLETYTMRTANVIHAEIPDEACPSASEPVCLLGLRPFLGVVDLFLTDSYLVILSSSEDPPPVGGELTVYSLELPSVEILFKDMIQAGESHKYTTRTVYYHLLCEGHTLLCTATRLAEKPVNTSNRQSVSLYKESCALLAEYHLTCESEEDHELGFKYAMMANLLPIQMMERLKKVEAEAKINGCTLDTGGGLCYYLKKCLGDKLSDEDGCMPPQALNTLLDLVESRPGPSLLPHLVLISPVLRQFSTERSIRIINHHIQHNSEGGSTEEYLALAVLFVMRSKIPEAGQSLSSIQNDGNSVNNSLVETLVNYWQLLFDPVTQVMKGAEWDWEGITFSDISVLLMSQKPLEFSLTLSNLVSVSSILQLEQVLQVFLTYLPSSVGTSNSCSAGCVLQKFLESVFSNLKINNADWKPEDNVDIEALKILMRSYLSDLVAKGNHPATASQTEPFSVKRPQFLQCLEPFTNPDAVYHPSLINLQCLLCTSWLDECALTELVQFVSEYVSPPLRLSLLVLAQPNKAVDLLLTNAPNALPLYSKEMLKDEVKLRYLISAIQAKIEEDDDGSAYEKIIGEVLDQLARTLPWEEFLKVVPPGDNYQDYILTCQRMAHADHIRSVIMATGQKLLATLNL